MLLKYQAVNHHGSWEPNEKLFAK